MRTDAFTFALKYLTVDPEVAWLTEFVVDASVVVHSHLHFHVVKLDQTVIQSSKTHFNGRCEEGVNNSTARNHNV